ncbi:hypothetical protein SGCOL_007502 [Colletotrichum sp. CLE4]
MSDKRRTGRVVTSCLDGSSNSYLLVYNDGEYVAYMGVSTKKTRTALYMTWDMGGTTDGVTDLQKYYDVPAPKKDWAQFKQLAVSGLDPKSNSTRNRNWTEFDCTHICATDQLHYDEPSSICNTHGSSKGMDGDYSGLTGQLIRNSLVVTRNIHDKYYDALYKAAPSFVVALYDMENKLAPIPPEEDDTWLLLIDSITIRALSAATPFFNTFLKSLPKFVKPLDNFKDTSMTLIGRSSTIAKYLLPNQGEPD